jgi:hypothetical protein
MLTARENDLHRLVYPTVKLHRMAFTPGVSELDKKLNALFGEICLVDSADFLQNGEDIDTAFSILQDIQPLDRSNISTLEELVLQKKAIAWGRLHHFQGRFLEARRVLEAIYNSGPCPKVWFLSAHQTVIWFHTWLRFSASWVSRFKRRRCCRRSSTPFRVQPWVSKIGFYD